MSHTFDATFWEEHYHGPSSHPHPPHPHLVDTARHLAPGRALDAGCGEGANALWLASHGWRVTAVDIASSALDRAREHADALPPAPTGHVEWVQADLTASPPAKEHFDLVYSHYVHTTNSDRALLDSLSQAVVRGGTLLIVGHAPQEEGDHPHRPAPGSHIRAEELAELLDPRQWQVIVAEPRTRTVTAPDGRQVTLHDGILRARRH